VLEGAQSAVRTYGAAVAILYRKQRIKSETEVLSQVNLFDGFII
jgi:hypothetical protein